MMETTKQAAPVADEFQQAWNYGWLGEPCPEPPADLDYWQVDGWLAAYQQGLEAVAKKRRKEADRLEALAKARASQVTAEQRDIDRRDYLAARDTAKQAEALAAQGAPKPKAVVFSVGYQHWRVATAKTHEVTLGSWKTHGGAKRAAERAGFEATIHCFDTAKEAIQRLKA